MIDSVLKGTGNSRFLKSAVPAGTSWADALAMLQAGTFPIDFNGINTEGFQQVGTPLNKANLLKDATAAQIGLPPSTTPDGMFQALGNTGELHVWRKTVVSKTPGYNLSVAQKNYLSSGSNYGSGNSRVTFTVSASVSVADDGTVTQNSPSSETYIYHQDVVSNVQNQIRGKFVSITTDHTSGYYSEPQDGIWFVPNDANITLVENGTSLGYPYNYCYVADKMQKVTGYGKGTTTTYPVSTNPNAYQEGSDAKPAGYTLGEVETGKFKMSATPTSNTFYVNSTIAVTDAGTISFPDGYHFISVGQNSSGPISARDVLGNFMSLYQNKYDGDFEVGDVWFIPSDATITDYVYVNKRQRVTGYAAVPAGTTIEYLGKLGDKARVQVVSYVGTGTYGANNKNSLTFDFPPKILLIAMAQLYSNQTYTGILYPFVGYGSSLLGSDRGYVYDLLCSRNGNSVSWWNESDYGNQLNISGYKYTAIAIG